MDVLKEIAIKVEAGDMATVKSLTEQAVKEKIAANDILQKGLIGGMLSIGVKFKANEVFIPEVLIAARAMKSGLEIVKPLLGDTNTSAKGKILIGTVKGDLHDIGKNIVIIMLEGAGYNVVDLGIDLPKEKFIEAIQREQPQVLGMSALLTTTMGYMKEVIDAMKEAGLRDKVKVILGGAPITQEFTKEIGADAYGPDAASSVDVIGAMLH